MQNARDISPDVLEYIPRDISLAYVAEDGSKFYFSPLRDIIGGVLATSPTVLTRALEDTQIYKQWQKRQFEAGKSYTPLFPWADELLKEKDIAGLVRHSIKNKDKGGTYTLFDRRPNEVFPEGVRVYKDTISATIKAKSRAKDRISRFYTTNRSGANLSRNGEIQIKSMHCRCEDFAHGKEKAEGKFNMACLHQGALGREYYLRRNFPEQSGKLKGKPPHESPFVPFMFVQNYDPGTKSIIYSRNPGLAALEYDALVAYYVIAGDDDKHFGIDKRLLSIPDIYAPAVMEGIRQGKIRREIVGQRPAMPKRPIEEIEAENFVYYQMKRALLSRGYVPVGRCLEFGDNVAVRYENENDAVSIVFGEGPMYYVRRFNVNELTDIEPFATRGEADTNPFSLLGEKNTHLYDDRTMRHTKADVQLPSALRLPETGDNHIHIEVPGLVKESAKKAIEESPAGNMREGKLKYARLYYD